MDNSSRIAELEAERAQIIREGSEWDGDSPEELHATNIRISWIDSELQKIRKEEENGR